MTRLLQTALLAVGATAFASTLTGQTKPVTKVDFQHDVQPILSAHCVRCHAHDQKSGGLALDTNDAITKGGSTGKSVIPGKANDSLLLKRILGQGGPRMPMGFGPLNDHDISLIKAWIDQGCIVSSGKRVHWAYVPPIRPAVPKLNNPWVRNPIDAFVLKKIHENNLSPSPEADKTTLIRRITLDLTGLPPTPEEVDAFNADKSPNAYEKVVDRLFASKRYGERMALPWLDAARYADSNGFQQDGDNYQYVWRDWVVKSMNANMPFDEFTKEQIAGDLMPGASEATEKGRDLLVATGFNRNHMLNNEGGAIPEEQRSVALFDRVDTTSTTWLGVTMTCARCHDHKYDPLTQRDYYSMMAFFNNLPETGIPTENDGSHYISSPYVLAGTPEQMTRFQALTEQDKANAADVAKMKASPSLTDDQTKWEAGFVASPPKSTPADILAIAKQEAAKRKPDEASRLREYFIEHGLTGAWKTIHDKAVETRKQLDQLRNELPKVMSMSDKQPRKTHVFSRGNYLSLLQEVGPSTPLCFSPMPPSEPKNRLGLADWMCSASNPLTARVQVNRYWQIFFGKGLVKTPENFGVQAEPPSNPELLDWLAVEFRESGWNVKRLQKLMVMSSTYRQTSKISKVLAAKDPENRFLARGARFRLPSMLLRDDALAASGLLNPAMGGKPVYPYQPKGIWDGLAITDERDFTYPQSKGTDLYKRSIYTFWRRTIAPGDMFDASSRQVCTVRQSQTSTPLHALTMLNDVVWVEAGRALGERIIREVPGGPEARLTEAFRRVCARRPSPSELSILKRALYRAVFAYQKDPKAADTYLKQGESAPNKTIDPIENAAYATVCLAIFNLDEALTRE